jgi:hypothetical protein
MIDNDFKIGLEDYYKSKNLIGKTIGVAVPFLGNESKKFFWYFGKVINIDQNSMYLEKDGLPIIVPLSEIRQITTKEVY